MTTSLIENIKTDSVMSQSLDPSALSNNQKNIIQQEILSKNLEQPLNAGPLAAASKMVPVPESLMSPDCYPKVNTTILTNNNNLNKNKISTPKSKGK